ncbi:MAG: DUF2179 domain-containing protein [Candidatus Syntrophonatronum acetioxidans]|uniref:UPF0316 protein D5R97_00085 n=1 Tax=Candidatus Syntrophonatronum acetioxidans TaxID=1795816 RepID=A0A424YJ81_9FIRM|nr:MAG: DUF2179 domain-containing protein [Candidatus Syntrophonatronum acetioxidans]
MELLIGYFIVFVARASDISLATIRILMILHGQRLYAALIGFFESLIFISVLTYVIQGLSDIPSLIFYALGFATGNYVGIFVEDKVAIGCVTVQVISKKDPESLVSQIRQKGFGVTVIEGYGREGVRKILHVLLKRKDLKILMELIENMDEKAFITILDTKKIMGGYFSRIKYK